MDIDAYLARIGCSAPCSPTLETLRRLHLRHLLSVPFENLTIHTGARVSLELPQLYDKIVRNRRGGFCYENNGLFSWLLSQLGFKVDILAAQVKNRLTRVYGPPFDHFIMAVRLDGRQWLCDVGFGSGFQHPLALDTDSPQKQSHGVYRIRHQEDTIFMEMQTGSDVTREPRTGDGWTELYKFTLVPRQREDFRAMCEYHQSSISSMFFCKSLCSLLLPNGRITIMGRKLIITDLSLEQGQPTKTDTDNLSDDEIMKLLREMFGVALPAKLVPKDVDIVPPPVNY